MDAQVTTASSGAPRSSTAATIRWLLLALLGHLALIDAAIETFLGGTPMRWWLSPGLLVLTCSSAWLWRPGGKLLSRGGPAGAAVTPFLLLLATLAAATWLPGGQENAVRLCLQPTPRLIGIVMAIGVLIAGYVLLRVGAALSGVVRLVGMALAALLTIYAVAALGLAVRDNVSLSAVFAGGALWERLPRWLQGPTVGLGYVLPFAILLQFPRIASSLRLRRPLQAVAYQTTAMVMVAVMAASGWMVSTSGPGSAPQRTGAARNDLETRLADFESATRQAGLALAGKPVTSLDEARRRLNQAFDLLAAQMSDPEQLFTPAAVVQRVGKDPVQLFQWVRDNTTWLPYQGALRGATGVLLERRGNSLDRALLLAALLKTAGHTQVRLAHAVLSREQSRSALAGLSQPPRGVSNVAPPRQPDASRRLAADEPEQREKVEKALAARRDAAAKVVASTRAAASNQSNVLLDVIGRTRLAQGDGDDLAAAASDHWWLQLADGGEWRDFDTLLDRNTAGGSVPTSDRVVEPDKLPAELRHSVDLRIIVEQLAGGRLSEHVVLQKAFFAADVVGVPIRVANIPAGAKPAQVATVGSAQKTVLDWAAREKVWVPLLSFGGERFVQGAFATTGETLRLPSTGGMPSAAGLAGGLSGMLGGEAEPPPQPRAEGRSDGEAVAEWLEFEIHAQGKTRKVRREIFDVLGASARSGDVSKWRLDAGLAARRSVGFLSQTEVGIFPGSVPGDYLAWLRAQPLLANRALIARLLTEPAAKRDALLLEALPKLATAGGPEFDFAAAREMTSDVAAHVFLSEPNVVAFHTGFLLEGQDKIGAYRAVDIVWNYVSVLPGGRSPSETRFRQGIADSIAEGLVLTSSCCAAPSQHEGALWGSGNQTGQWVLVGSGKELQSLRAHPDVAARMSAALAQGAMVMAPAAASDEGAIWWSVDRTSGQTLAIGTHGWGDTAEKGLLETLVHFIESSVGHFIIEVICLGLCVTFTVMQAVAFDAPVGGTIGVFLCLIGSAMGIPSGLITDTSVMNAVGGGLFGFGRQATWLARGALSVEAIHAVISIIEQIEKWVESGHEGEGEGAGEK